jgi:hypothetical protein
MNRAHDTEFAASHILAIGPEHVFTIDGCMWTVREAIDPVTQTPVLIFTSDRVGRRVRLYPANWRELSDKELHGLSWST